MTQAIGYRGQSYDVSVGFDDAGAVQEVFANGAREGSDMQHVLSDACVLISIALQHGITAEELAKSLGTLPSYKGIVPASPIGAVLDVVKGAAAPRLNVVPK